MPEPPTDVNQPEPGCPAAPRRVIAQWEYKTAYIEAFQVRIPARLHERLCEWAKQERNCRELSASRFLRRRSAAAEPSDSVPGFTPPRPTPGEPGEPALRKRLFLRFRGLETGIRRNCFHSKHL